MTEVEENEGVSNREEEVDRPQSKKKVYYFQVRLG
jgi:hypothetical protein